MPQMFISHSVEDAAFAQQLARRIEAAGVEVWIAPDSIRPGEEFVDAIQRGLASASHFVLIMSPEAFESQWVKLEMNTAIRLERNGTLTIAPIIYRPCDPPLLLGNFQWLEYDGDLGPIVRRLLSWMGLAEKGSWARPRPMSETQLAATQQTLDVIAAEALACTRCPLHATRQMAVPGAGPANARLMFIGEAPGPEEDRVGQPFIAASGQFLAELLDLIGVRREEVYMTNMVKCHPPEKRAPLPVEMDACSDYLSRQIEALDPEVIVTLGATSLGRLMPGAKLSAIHGQPQQVGGRIVVPMYHPAAAMYQSRYRSILVKDFLAMEEFLSNHHR